MVVQVEELCLLCLNQTRNTVVTVSLRAKLIKNEHVAYCESQGAIDLTINKECSSSRDIIQVI